MSSITVKKCDLCGAIEEAEKPMPYTHERYKPPHETDFAKSIQTGHNVDVCTSCCDILAKAIRWHLVNVNPDMAPPPQQLDIRE